MNKLRDVLQKRDIKMLESGQILTTNNKGTQMSKPSPGFLYWIKGWDRKHPILDIGCGYGINTLAALDLQIETVAVDASKVQVEVVNELVDNNLKYLLTCQVGLLPNNIPDTITCKKYSSILISDVLHFLTGDEIEKTFALCNKLLIKGGTLTLNTAAMDLDDFKRGLEKGEKGPGLHHFDDIDDVKKKHKLDDKSVPHMIHGLSIEQIKQLCLENNFSVEILEFFRNDGWVPSIAKEQESLFLVATKIDD